MARNLSFRTVTNYFSALKQAHLRLGIYDKNFEAPLISSYLKAIAKIRPSVVVKKGVYTMDQLDQLFRVNSQLPSPLPFKLAFALGVFALLRISNLVPPSEKYFNPDKHLTRADVTVTTAGAEISIKWAKNLQRTDNTHIVRVPRFTQRPYLCPVLAIEQTLATPPYAPSAPLVIKGNRPVTKRAIRQRLALINRHMGLDQSGLTFHALRRTGVTLLFGKDVPLSAIRSHGAWASDAIWQYVKNTDEVADRVPHTFVDMFR